MWESMNDLCATFADVRIHAFKTFVSTQAKDEELNG